MAPKTRDPALAAFESLFGAEFGHGKALGLKPLRQALAALGEPQERLARVVHVAGTNGKGSTIAFLRAIAEAAGLRVNAFTKPHLMAFNERFVVAGKAAPDEALIAAARRLAAHAPALTQFDAQIAAAFLLWAETPADITLLETGMGGREDSSNVVSRPAAVVLTPIALDHQDALGATLDEIAAHKAGILKPGAPAIVARQADAARAIIEAEAQRLGAPLYRQGAEWDAFAQHGRLLVQSQTRLLDLPLPTLVGAHQIDNAGLAAATFLMTEIAAIDDDAFAAGVRQARWPGRLQPLGAGALSAPIRAGGGEVWVDVGHNAHAAEALARALRGMQAKRAAPTIAIVAMRARKDAESFIAALAGALDLMIAVPLDEPHVAPAQMASIAQAFGIAATSAPSLAAAMQNAAQSPAPRVLISGSFLLAGEALAAENA